MQTDSGRQSGNVIAFIVVGVALAALLAGGIYASKQQGRVASRADTVAVNTEDSSKNQPAESQNEADASKDNEQSQPQNTQQQPQNPAPAAPTTNDNNNSGSGTSSQNQVPHTGPSTIASTGPADGLIATAALGLLTVGTVSYVRSQRSFRSSALK